jgi:phage terminase small subunit
MPVLSEPRHERFCQLRIEGKTIDQAYIDAGFKANRSNAARLNANDHIQARMEELLAARQKALVEEGRWSAVSLFNRMHELIDKAVEKGEIKAAIDGHKTILECFGYMDSPTLTHEHVKGQKIQADQPAEGQGDANAQAGGQPAGAAVLHISKALRELKRKTAG